MYKKMFTIEKFMWHWSLETGGLVISRFLLCIYIITQCIIGYRFVRTIIDCQSWKKPLAHDKSDPSCYEINSTFILAGIAVVLFALMIICYLSMKGTTERKFLLIKPLMICMGVASVVCAISIVSNLINGIILFILHGYMFMVLYSLYKKLKEEKESEENESEETAELPESKI